MAQIPSVESYVPAPLDSIPLNIELPFPLFIPVAGKMTCFRNAKDQLTTERLETLKGKVDTIFIPQGAWMAFAETLEKILEAKGLLPEIQGKNLHSLLFVYAQHLEELKSAHRGTVNKLRDYGYKLAQLLNEYPEVAPKLLHRYSSSGVYFANHNVNVAVYSLAIAKKLQMRLEDRKGLAYACLVHNIGNILIPQEILHKKGELSVEEWKIMQGHSYQGSELLEYLNAPLEIVLTARHHHERVDGAGYPNELEGSEIHLYAKICGIADVYDALTSHRPSGKTPLSSKEAVETMKSMTGKFDSQIIAMVGTA